MDAKLSSPAEPVISTNECYAALKLIKLMCQQMEERVTYNRPNAGRW